MQVDHVGHYYVVKNEHFWVKSVFPHVSFTTSECEAMLCFTKTEADAIQEYIGERFAF